MHLHVKIASQKKRVARKLTPSSTDEYRHLGSEAGQLGRLRLGSYLTVAHVCEDGHLINEQYNFAVGWISTKRSTAPWLCTTPHRFLVPNGLRVVVKLILRMVSGQLTCKPDVYATENLTPTASSPGG